MFLIEFIRVTQVNNGWIKNSLPIDFPVQDLILVSLDLTVSLPHVTIGEPFAEDIGLQKFPH